MSASNPMHREPPARTPRRPVWPFPVQPLAYPTLAPDARPVRAPVPYPTNAPAAPF